MQRPVHRKPPAAGRRGLAVLAGLVLLAGTHPRAAGAQERDLDTLGGPVGGSWDLVKSLGQPPVFRTYGSIGYGIDRSTGIAVPGASLSFGVRRAVGNPVTGLLSTYWQAYAGQRGNEFDAGARGFVELPVFFAAGGLDWNGTLGRVDPVFGLTFPLRRGGWPLPGAEFRVEWIPSRGNSVGIAGMVPFRQPLAGRTRARQWRTTLPRAEQQFDRVAARSTGQAYTEIREVAARMRRVVSIATFYWLISERSLGYERNVTAWRARLATFSAEFLPEASRQAGEPQFHRETRAYYAALDRAFGFAAGALDGVEAESRGRPFSDAARKAALVEAVLPYNRSIGQYRQPNSLDGFLQRARARFSTWLVLHSTIDAARQGDAMAILDRWLIELEATRAYISELAPDDRMNWIPLGIVLRPEEHQTQEQIDDLLEAALGTDFESGNLAFTIDAPRFQWELRRSIHETRSYHVLWVHDYRGRNARGLADITGFEATMTYLRALRNAVEDYDRSGRIPTYIILIDQFFYEENNGRFWLSFLERPLGRIPKLGRHDAHHERQLRFLQDSLRTAIEGSVRLQSQVASFGGDWLERLVKVHVNVTNPSDFTFRSRKLLGLPLGADNISRDHRKLVLRDVDEANPEAGELILAGVGVGDHYTTPSWEDRAMIVRGPGAVATRRHLRDVLQRHGISGDALPAPLRERPRAADYAVRIDSLTRSGAVTRFMQAHNVTGWGNKDATFLQMLMYDLAPARTIIVVPDGLWTSYQWMAQLVGASLRGCHVLVIAPARDNAPSSEFPQMSVMQELITRLTLVDEVIGPAIRFGGGDLRIGLYARRDSLNDLSTSLDNVRHSFARYPFLREYAPLSEASMGVFAAKSEELRLRVAQAGQVVQGRDSAFRSSAALVLVPDGRAGTTRLPQLHRKTQWLIGADLLRAVVSAPVMPMLLTRGLDGFSFGATDGDPQRPDPTDPRGRSTWELMGIYNALPQPVRDNVLYFMAGSINKNVRSMVLDAEVMGVISGPWVMESFLDLLILSSSVTWVESLGDVERLLPPYNMPQRLLGRWLHRIL
jgi:hypothetical protein